MALIGNEAKPKKEVSYGDMFKRISYIGNLFGMAETLATKDMPLINHNPTINRMANSGITVYAFSDIPVSEQHDLVLAVGSPETGFYQVPVIQLAGGKGEHAIDVMVSGTINEKGKAESFENPRKLTEISQEFYRVGIENANRVYAVALVPKSEFFGDEVVVGGRGGIRVSDESVYHMIVNGFALERKIVSNTSKPSFLVHTIDTFAPVMFPGEDGEERYLRLGDILSEEGVKDMENKGMFPGLTFAAGYFRQQRDFDLALRCAATPRSPHTLGGGYLCKGRAGRVGLEQGSKSDVKYGKTSGTITGIDGVLALHFIGIEQDTAPETVRAEIKKLVG